MRSKAKGQPGYHRDKERECEDTHVQLHAAQQRKFERRQMRNAARRNEGEKYSKKSPGAREQQAFRKQLPDQPPAARTERGAYGDLLLARGGSCQHEVRQVRAHNQHDYTDSAREYYQSGPDLTPHVLRENGKLWMERVPVPVLIRNLVTQNICFRLRSRQRGAGFQPAHQCHGVAHSVRAPGERKRGKEIRVRTRREDAAEVEGRGHHAHHCHQFVVQAKRFAYDVRVARKAALPESMT